VNPDPNTVCKQALGELATSEAVMLSLRDAVGHENVPSLKDSARRAGLVPPFTLEGFIFGRMIQIGINVPGGVHLARAGDEFPMPPWCLKAAGIGVFSARFTTMGRCLATTLR
jgi:hypothetical protein